MEVDFSDIQIGNGTAKIVLAQAVAHTLALMLTLVFPMIYGCLNILGGVEKKDIEWMTIPISILFPLQGFFNFIIFCWQKVYNYYKVNNEEESYCSIICLFFRAGKVLDTILITSISVVQADNERDDLTSADIENESTRQEVTRQIIRQVSYSDDSDSMASSVGMMHPHTLNISIDSQPTFNGSDVLIDEALRGKDLSGFSARDLSGFSARSLNDNVVLSNFSSNASTIKA